MITLRATSRYAAACTAASIPGAWYGYHVSQRGYKWFVYYLT